MNCDFSICLLMNIVSVKTNKNKKAILRVLLDIAVQRIIKYYMLLFLNETFCYRVLYHFSRNEKMIKKLSKNEDKEYTNFYLMYYFSQYN